METCIDPKLIEILKQLDAMKDPVIVAGRSAADQDREAHKLRCEIDAFKGVELALRKNIRSADTKLRIGDSVRIYDSYRFASLPITLGNIVMFGEVGNVCVKLTKTNNPQYPEGSDVWVHTKQVEITSNANPTVESASGEPKLSLSVYECKQVLGYGDGYQSTLNKLNEFIKENS